MAAAPCQSCLLCQRETVPGCSSQTTPGQPCAACNCGLRAFWRQSARGGQGSSTSPISTHYFVSNILLVLLLYSIMACMTNMINHVFSPKKTSDVGVQLKYRMNLSHPLNMKCTPYRLPKRAGQVLQPGGSIRYTQLIDIVYHLVQAIHFL